MLSKDGLGWISRCLVGTVVCSIYSRVRRLGSAPQGQDISLTPVGCQQAETLGRTFPYSDKLGLIIKSPTSPNNTNHPSSFTNVLNKRSYVEGSEHGVKEGAQLLIDPDLQVRSALPCDTGSDRPALEIAFPSLDFSPYLQSSHLRRDSIPHIIMQRTTGQERCEAI